MNKQWKNRQEEKETKIEWWEYPYVQKGKIFCAKLAKWSYEFAEGFRRIKNEIFLQLAIGIPFFLVLLYLIKLPESVRWAWTVGKIDIANQVISKMSEINHVEIPEEFLLKQKPKIVAKNEAGMGSLIASVELRGMYNIGILFL